MENRQLIKEKFKTPEEELDFLRGEVERRERELKKGGTESSRERIAQEEVRNYRETRPEAVLHQSHHLPEAEAEGLALGLAPETHDRQMMELIQIIRAKGIKNAMAVLARLRNPHLADDFEKFLVQLVKAGFDIGLGKKNSLFRALQMTLYEVTLPEAAKEDRPKTLKEFLSSMEQFYAGMLSATDEKLAGPNYFTLELAVENQGSEFIFYAAVPDSKKNLFEKQILSIFPTAKITERKNDYNIFNDTGRAVGSVATLYNNPIFPLKTYEQFDHDPLNVILNSFSKINVEGEGAAIQISIAPAGDKYHKRYKYALDQVVKGEKISEATDLPDTFGEHAWKFAREATKELFGSSKKKEKAEEKKIKEPPKVDETAVENIKQKIVAPIVIISMRIIASARTEREAEAILSDLESAFNQLENPHHGNKLVFEKKRGGRLADLFHDFSYRLFDESAGLPLNLRELTTIMHFPGQTITVAPQLKISKAATAPAPLGLSAMGTLLGVNRDRNTETKIFMAPEDRLRHFYTIGQTGTGKTAFLKNMIVQDIARGEGVCFIDPHGSDIQDILAQIPESRYEDVIYFDPAYTLRPMALNMLEYNRAFPEQKTFVVNELFSIFQKLYGAIPESMGPMFEQYFRNATLLVIEDPDSGSTLIDVSRVMSNKAFRDLKISRCKNPVVVQFWREVAEKAGGEAALANIVPYITSKFDVFLANDIMRPIIAQEKSSWNFRDIMDNKKIMLVNLSKGRLGDINANLIGLIIVGKILMAALSRVDSLGKDLPPFYLYIDEFQNITTDSISTILSEARKYRLALTVAHQFIKQLDEKIKDSVFGNVGSIAAFRVGAEDAEFLEKQFAPVFTAKDLMNLDNYNAYLKLLAHGKTVKPFSMETIAPSRGNIVQVDQLKELSYLKFGRERSAVETEVAGKYQPPRPSATPFFNQGGE
ncbi:MAG TPA: TraM recognition domain-containing protein [Candidatus Paceibacterota bacterium]